MKAILIRTQVGYLLKDEADNIIASSSLSWNGQRLDYEKCDKIFGVPKIEKTGLNHLIRQDWDTTLSLPYNQGFLRGFVEGYLHAHGEGLCYDDVQRAFTAGINAQFESKTLGLSKEEATELHSKRLIALTTVMRSNEIKVDVETVLQVRHGVEWHSLPGQDSGRDPEGIYRHHPVENDEGFVIIKKIK